MELVFRIEKDGDGPYWPLDYIHRPYWMHQHNVCRNHPAPRNDLLRWSNRDDFLFGFEYEHQLYSWFEPEALEWLRDKGYKCFVYEADEYTMNTGKYQCAFDKTTATRIREIPL